MSCWTLNLLETMIALFYLMHIMLKKCFKNLSIFIIYLSLHPIIHTWLRIMAMVFCKKNMHKWLVAICPNITYIVSRLSRYTHIHGIEHCDAISKLVKFLKGTINFGLSYCDYFAILKRYCDANCIFIQMSKTY